MGDSKESLRQRLGDVAVDTALAIEGRTETRDDWRSFEVSLSAGLLFFHHTFVTIFVSRMDVVDDDETVLEEARVTDEAMLSGVRSVLTAFWDTRGSLGAVGIDLAELSTSQIQMAAFLCNHADAFVLAHELGHVLMGAAPKAVRKERMIIEAARENMVLPRWSEHRIRGEDADIDAWCEEISADLIGANLAGASAADPADRMIRDAAAVMSLVMCDMLEKYYERMSSSIWDYRIHPPADLRLDVLETVRTESHPHWLGQTFRRFSDYVMASL